MKRTIAVLFTVLVLLCPNSSGSQEKKAGLTSVNGFPLPQVDRGDKWNPQEETNPPYPYDQSIIAPKLFQKTLPPLSKKEKIIWSFRTAKANIFL